MAELVVMSREDMGLLRMVADELMSNSAATRMLQVLAFATCFLQWAASLAAICLLILDRTNWRTKMQTSLLVPYTFVSLPHILFSFLRGVFGKWVALIAVVLQLFFPSHFQDWLEMPGSLVFLFVVAPNIFTKTLRNDQFGFVVCLMTGFYLLQEHLRAAGGFKKSLTQTHSFLNTLGIILLLVYPIWCLVPYLQYL